MTVPRLVREHKMADTLINACDCIKWTPCDNLQIAIFFPLSLVLSWVAIEGIMIFFFRSWLSLRYGSLSYFYTQESADCTSTFIIPLCSAARNVFDYVIMEDWSIVQKQKYPHADKPSSRAISFAGCHSRHTVGCYK